MSLTLNIGYDLQALPKSKEAWISMAKKCTIEVKENGSASPLVWIFVEGKDIPPNALVAGVAKHQPLFIARAFYEGGMYLGTAGHHLKTGAVILYNGREREVSAYEVLVPAFQPIRYIISDSLPIVKEHLNKEQLNKEQPKNRGLERLNRLKTVILVDDSPSMEGELWNDAREALAGVADLAAKYNSDGVDVHFLNNTHSVVDIKNSQDVRELFDSVLPDGETPTGAALSRMFNKYLPLLENKRRPHKPVCLIVITDGVPTDDPKEVIIDAARRLDHTGVPLNKFGIQFVQIGDDTDATNALKELDDGIAGENGIRDMVDTTPYRPDGGQFTVDSVIKILLGSIDKLVDELN
jgi:uncharacterized protein YegL